jgi:hypothetical protein
VTEDEIRRVVRQETNTALRRAAVGVAGLAFAGWWLLVMATILARILTSDVAWEVVICGGFAFLGLAVASKSWFGWPKGPKIPPPGLLGWPERGP